MASSSVSGALAVLRHPEVQNLIFAKPYVGDLQQPMQYESLHTIRRKYIRLGDATENSPHSTPRGDYIIIVARVGWGWLRVAQFLSGRQPSSSTSAVGAGHL